MINFVIIVSLVFVDVRRVKAVFILAIFMRDNNRNHDNDANFNNNHNFYNKNNNAYKNNDTHH